VVRDLPPAGRAAEGPPVHCIVSRAATISILADSVTTGRDAEAAFKRRSQLRSLRPHASRP
jgi:hypothetical protein